MNFMTMFQDLLNSAIQKPVTRLYPLEKQPAPARLRGRLHWHSATCTGCALCNKDCPANALSLFILDKKAKRYAMDYYPERCIFCGQCVTSCRFESLSFVNEEWELATSEHQVMHYGDSGDVANRLTEDAGSL